MASRHGYDCCSIWVTACCCEVCCEVCNGVPVYISWDQWRGTFGLGYREGVCEEADCVERVVYSWVEFCQCSLFGGLGIDRTYQKTVSRPTSSRNHPLALTTTPNICGRSIHGCVQSREERLDRFCLCHDTIIKRSWGHVRLRTRWPQGKAQGVLVQMGHCSYWPTMDHQGWRNYNLAALLIPTIATFLHSFHRAYYLYITAAAPPCLTRNFSAGKHGRVERCRQRLRSRVPCGTARWLCAPDQTISTQYIGSPGGVEEVDGFVGRTRAYS